MSDRPRADQTPSPASRPSLVNRLSGTMHERPELRTLALAGLFIIAVFVVLYIARSVFIPLTLALMLSFLLRPVVKGLRRLYIPSPVGAGLVVVLLVGAGGYGVARLAGPATEWTERLPKALVTLERKVRPLRREVEDVSEIAEKVERITQVEKGKKKTVRTVEVDKPSLLESALSTVGALAGGAVVMLIALYFMLIWGDTLIRKLIAFVPDLSGQARTTRVMERIERDMSGYLGTVSAINLLLGVAVGATMHLLGMPNPVLWGVLAGLVNFVPYIGSLVGVAAVALAAVVTFNQLTDALVPPAVYLVITALEGQVITPLVIGRTFRVSPLVVFIWLVFWAWLWGVAGAIVAVPMLVFLKITCEQSEALAPIADLLRR